MSESEGGCERIRGRELAKRTDTKKLKMMCWE